MAYNSTSWTTDSLTKATNSTSTSDSLNISGNLSVGGIVSSALTVGVDDTGYDVKFFGATSGRYMLWDESEDALQFADGAGATFGTGSDLTISHNGSHSYIANTTGTLHIGTTSSGVPISIGHTTSETTVNDNLTVTGNFDITNDSGVEINLNGSSAANIYSEGNLFIKAESGRTLQLGANGQLDSITIDTSENVEITGGNLTISGDLTVTGGRLTFGNAEYIANESDNSVSIVTNPSGGGSLIVSSGAATQAQIRAVNADSYLSFMLAGATKWSVGYDYSDSYTLKFDWEDTIGASTKLSLTSGGELILSGAGVVAMKETTTPTAVADYGRLYTKNDNKLYFQDGAGTEHEISYA